MATLVARHIDTEVSCRHNLDPCRPVRPRRTCSIARSSQYTTAERFVLPVRDWWTVERIAPCSQGAQRQSQRLDRRRSARRARRFDCATARRRPPDRVQRRHDSPPTRSGRAAPRLGGIRSVTMQPTGCDIEAAVVVEPRMQTCVARKRNVELELELHRIVRGADQSSARRR